ncbi:dihydrolipoamide acetyltransferase family protein [Rhizohabitans arisaemae]|uniref:dihydrolipoamide acetyltransferase family protein n=1 Tax=Rhizohabitans arisaemae TaxID=2720610 RepID=UPI0024B2283F|nr:dihydrolipoamide acetyltransferase family protein [Rhizohabitans arisaemae]
MSVDTLTDRTFRLPDLGEGLVEAEILEWKVAVGDTVEIDQLVVEVETAKAAVEVPVPFAGVVTGLHAGAGDVIGVGSPLISVGSAEPVPVAAERYREEERAGSGNVLIGYGTGHAPAGRRRKARAERRTTVVELPPPDAPATPAPAAETADPPRRTPLVISPLVRKLAREKNVDLLRTTPSGPGGVILRRDVEQAAALAGQAVAAPDSPAPDEDAVERIPLRGLRRAVAEKLTRSRTEIPDATTWVDVDATGLLAAKDILRAAAPDRRIGLLALLARICVAGLRRFPELNSSVDTARGEIVRYSAIHLGFAAQTDRGLVVPVVHNAHRMTTAQLAAEFARLTELARAGSLPPSALTGGTFTLNNYGVFGVDGSTPIINHPEAALLGVGRIVDRPWAVDGKLEVRKVTQLSFSFDHRVCDGGVAGGFLRYVADCVEHPETLLLDL